MTEAHLIHENTAQAVVFLEALADLVEKSPESYSADASRDLAAHIRGMAVAVTTSGVDLDLLEVTRAFSRLDWHNELVAVLFSPEHRPKMH